MKRTLDILLQILKYLYNIEPIGAMNFYSKYCIVGTSGGEDTANIYDFSRVNRRLPVAKSVSQAIALFQPLNTGLFTTPSSSQGGKIMLYSQDFARKILQKLQLFDKQYKVLYQIQELPQGPVLLKNVYQKPDDFPQYNNVIVLVGDDSYNNWRDRQIGEEMDNTSSEGAREIRTTIDNFSLRTLDPYLYKDLSGRTYLIQNTIANRSFDRATAIGAGWVENIPITTGVVNDNKYYVPQRINYGPRADPSDAKRPYLLYTINTAMGEQQNSLILIGDYRDKSLDEGKFVRIIKYFSDEDRYAAMLLL